MAALLQIAIVTSVGSPFPDRSVEYVSHTGFRDHHFPLREDIACSWDGKDISCGVRGEFVLWKKPVLGDFGE